MRAARRAEMSARCAARAGVGVDMRFPPCLRCAWLTHAAEGRNSDKLPKGYPGGRLQPQLGAAPSVARLREEAAEAAQRMVPALTARSRAPSLPAGARGLNNDVVYDGAHPGRELRGKAGRLLLLRRVDKSPQIDG